MYSASKFNLGGVGALFGGLSPKIPPVATGLFKRVSRHRARGVFVFDQIICAALSNTTLREETSGRIIAHRRCMHFVLRNSNAEGKARQQIRHSFEESA